MIGVNSKKGLVFIESEPPSDFHSINIDDVKNAYWEVLEEDQEAYEAWLAEQQD